MSRSPVQDPDGRWPTLPAAPAGHPAPGPVTHFKGGRYVVLGTALHTETSEPLTIYRSASSMDADFDFFARPEEMFLSTVVHEGRTVARFDTTAMRGQDRPDMLSTVEDVLAEQKMHPDQMIAVRALIDAQRGEAVGMLAAWQPGDDPEIKTAVASFLRLIDAAEHEIDVVLESVR